MDALEAELREMAERGSRPAMYALGRMAAYETYLDAFIAATVLALRALKADTGTGRKVGSIEAARMRRETIADIRKLLDRVQEAMGDEMPRL